MCLKCDGRGNSNRNAGRAVVLASFCIFLLSIGSLQTYGIYIAPLLEEFDYGLAVLGWISSTGFAIMNLTGPVANLVLRRLGCRLTVMLGGLILSVGMMLSSAANSTAGLFVFLGVLTGIGASLIFLSVPVILADYYTKHFSTAIGLAYAGICAGVALFPLVTTFLIETYGWRGAILIQGGMTCNIIAMGALFRPVSHIRRRQQPVKGSAEYPQEGRTQLTQDGRTVSIKDVTDQGGSYVAIELRHCERSVESEQLRTKDKYIAQHLDETPVIQNTTQKTGIGSVLQKCCISNNVIINTPIIIFAYVTTFLVSISYCASLTHITNQVILMGVSKRKAAAALSTIGIGGFFGRFFYGWFVDRKVVAAETLYVSSILLAAIGTLFNPVLQSYIGCVISAVTIGITVGSTYPLFYTILRKLTRLDQFATAAGLEHFFDGCGLMLGGYLAGLIRDILGSYQTGFYIFASVFLLAGCTFIPIMVILRRDSEHVANTSDKEDNYRTL